MAAPSMSDKYKEEMDKMKEEASEAISKFSRTKRDDDDEIEIPEEAEPHADVIVVNTMTYIDSRLQFQVKNDWYGSAHNGYPQTIWGPGTGRFTHWDTAPPRFSMGAVVYVGNNKHSGELDCAWLVAWNVTPNKVYVETGPSRKYVEGEIDWEDIKLKLQNSTTESFYVNGETRAKAYAQVNNRDNASVAVIFGVVD